MQTVRQIPCTVQIPWYLHGARYLSDCLHILNSFSIAGMDEATLFKFGKWVEYGRVRPRGEKFPPKGAWSESRDPIKNFKTLSIFMEWLKLHCLKLASGSNTASHARGKKIPPKMAWSGSGDCF